MLYISPTCATSCQSAFWGGVIYLFQLSPQKYLHTHKNTHTHTLIQMRTISRIYSYALKRTSRTHPRHRPTVCQPKSTRPCQPSLVEMNGFSPFFSFDAVFVIVFVAMLPLDGGGINRNIHDKWWCKVWPPDIRSDSGLLLLLLYGHVPRLADFWSQLNGACMYVCECVCVLYVCRYTYNRQIAARLYNCHQPTVSR